MRPWARLKLNKLPDMPAQVKPKPVPKAPISKGVITPRRSASLPIHMPPKPKPSIIKVYGKDALPRPTPNSAWTAGKTTAMTYMLALPRVMSARVMSKRRVACEESIHSAGAAVVVKVCPVAKHALAI